ncbi:MAG: 16S rRNA (guanine(527)-N(7))-methyltransferase RsmG [Candidatus Enteromonas sp.]|nr:16S rRNA (guanine(527)-N(7))-methyltransferase RsmG [Candidatus Enteromonas sp.]
MTYEELALETAKLGLSLSPDTIEKLHRYAVLLKEWNEKMNLTAITEENEVIEKHFYDSLLAASVYDFSNKKIADIGSGAGFPGMVLALVYPSAKVTLIDATKKKFLFLETVVKELQIPNVKFHIGRVEDMKMERETFDCVTSRGFAAMNVFLEVAAPLTRVNGIIVALKGLRGEEELHAALNAEQKLDLHLRKRAVLKLPSGDTRSIFTFEKTRKTSPKYPRPWAEISKKPL